MCLCLRRGAARGAALVQPVLAFVSEHQNRCPREFHLHHRFADRQRGNTHFHFGDDDRLERVGLRLVIGLVRGEDIRGCVREFNRFGTLTVMIFQPALVAAKLLVHLFVAAVEGGIDLVGVGLCLGGQTCRQMHNRFAHEFMPGFRENHGRIGGAAGVFLDGGAQFIGHMCSQGFADIDLLAGDLIAHLVSFV
jgi:hypothetical protein